MRHICLILKLALYKCHIIIIIIIMDILGCDKKLIKVSGRHIVDSVLYIINDSPFSIEIFLMNEKLPEWLLYLKTMET